eukprot:99469_1
MSAVATKQFLKSAQCIVTVQNQEYNLRNAEHRYLMVQHLLCICKSSISCRMHMRVTKIENIDPYFSQCIYRDIMQYELLCAVDQLLTTMNIQLQTLDRLNDVLYNRYYHIMNMIFSAKYSLI